MTPVHLARINYAGDLGYELWVAPEYQRELFDRIVAAGEPHGLRLFGMRALMSLRLEKSYGTWFREYRPIYTPLEARHQALHPARPRVHRAGGVRGEVAAGGPTGGSSRSSSSPIRTTRPTSSATSRSGTATRSSAGSRRAATATTSGSRSRWATCRRRSRHPTGRTAAGSRSRSSAGAARRASSPSRCSTRRAGGCGRDGGDRAGRSRADRRRRAADRDIEPATPSRSRSSGPARHPARRDAVPGRRLRQLPGGRRRRRLRPDLPGRGARRDRRRAASGRREAATPRRSRLGSTCRSSGAFVESRRRSGAPDRAPTASRSLVLDAAEGNEVVGIYAGPDGRRPDPDRDAPRRGRGGRRRDRGGRDPAGLPGQRPRRAAHAAGRRARLREAGVAAAGAASSRSGRSWSGSTATPPAASRAVVTARWLDVPARTVDRRPGSGAARPAGPDGAGPDRRSRRRRSAADD